MITTRKATLALGLSTLLFGGLQADAASPTDELVGGYTIVSGEKYGVKEPEDKIKGTTVRFTENAVVVTTPDKKEAYASTFKIDDSAKPWKITMVSKLSPGEGMMAKGLIKRDGDTVTLIYAIEGGEMPTEFKTKDKQLMFVMKNMKK